MLHLGGGKMLNKEKLAGAVVDAIRNAETKLSEDTYRALKEAKGNEEFDIAKTQLQAIIDNADYAREKTRPMCQDTGLQTFFIEVGYDFPFTGILKDAIIEGVRRATREIPVRPNTVHPITGKNSGDNTGKHVPYITWELVEGNEAKITVLPKGGGSENMSALAMLPPGVGIDGVKKFVIERVAFALGKPCPPGIIGVGIGGGADLSLKLGKKAILRPVGVRHEEKEIADLELELLEAINSLGSGPMGLGGKTTALDVHVEYAHRHPASLPVGVVFQCWANRRAFIKIDSNGNVEVS